MAWCRQATIHYLGQPWPTPMSPCGVTWPQLVNRIWCWLVLIITIQVMVVPQICMMTSSNGKNFLRYWSFVWKIHRSPVNSPHKGQWRRALMFSFICAWINCWPNNREAGDSRHHRAHYDVIVMDSRVRLQSLYLGLPFRWNWHPFRINYFRET